MWSSKLFAVAAVAATLVVNVSAHSTVQGSQALADAAQRSDVTSGSATSCKKPLANAATLNADNTVTVFAKNFNAGEDGGLQFTVGLSTTGATGKFSAVNVTKNGDPNPTTTETVPITLSVPAGTSCTDNCFLAFQSDGGFGDCLPLTGGSAGAASAAAAPAASSKAAASSSAAASTDPAAAASTTSAADSAATTAAGHKHHHHHGTAAAGAAAGAAAKNAKAKSAKVAAAEPCDETAGTKKAAARPHARAWYFE